jgi:hypothetical protein
VWVNSSSSSSSSNNNNNNTKDKTWLPFHGNISNFFFIVGRDIGSSTNQKELTLA